MTIREYLTGTHTLGFRPHESIGYDYHTWDLTGTEELLSTNNPGFWKASNGDVGGPFSVRRRVIKALPQAVHNIHYDGEMFPEWIVGAPYIMNGGGLPEPVNQEQLYVWGAEAIARTTPTNPTVNLLTILGELIGDKGLPSVPGRSTSEVRDKVSAARAAGSEYLNVEFGWLPLVSDLRSIAYAVKNRNRIINNYVKGSDKKLRRRLVLTSDREIETLYGTAVPNGLTGAGTGDGVYSATSSMRVWFSGAFRYHVPLGQDLGSKILRSEAIANHLLGTRLTPAVVWNLVPFSWLTDYWFNTSSVMTNISNLAGDGLVLQYGYLMCHKRFEARNDALSGYMAGASLSHVSETKQRISASPYGFGLKNADLTNRQKGVIAALGLTKGSIPWSKVT